MNFLSVGWDFVVCFFFEEVFERKLSDGERIWLYHQFPSVTNGSNMGTISNDFHQFE